MIRMCDRPVIIRMVTMKVTLGQRMARDELLSGRNHLRILFFLQLRNLCSLQSQFQGQIPNVQFCIYGPGRSFSSSKSLSATTWDLGHLPFSLFPPPYWIQRGTQTWVRFCTPLFQPQYCLYLPSLSSAPLLYFEGSFCTSSICIQQFI